MKKMNITEFNAKDMEHYVNNSSRGGPAQNVCAPQAAPQELLLDKFGHTTVCARPKQPALLSCS
jgi:hypothetical protein